MNQLLSICLLFILFSCKEQKQTTAKSSLDDKLVDYYNHEQYDSIFYLFDPLMKDALPQKQTVDFFTGLRKGSGEIIKHELIEKKQGFDRYKTSFTNDISWMNIAENDKGEISGLLFTAYDGPGAIISNKRNTTKMKLPFSGEWFVFWGGDTEAQNYHVVNRAQKNAFDIFIVDEKERSYKTNGKTNEDFYAFGQPLIAPCDAEVVAVIEGVKDNIPGEMNAGQVTGNTIVLKTAADEYLLFAHFKINSIKVKMGDQVKQGQVLGLCGNSGNTSEPHLHFHIQDKETMTGATGIKCFFDKIMVNGKEKTDYSPVKGERISN